MVIGIILNVIIAIVFGSGCQSYWDRGNVNIIINFLKLAQNFNHGIDILCFGVFESRIYHPVINGCSLWEI